MVSVIVAAHNEEARIGDCLDALLAQDGIDQLEVIVSANGCTDSTARVAADRGVHVVDRSEAGKTRALNAADALAGSFPRVYLDADIVLPPDAIRRVVTVLASSPTVLAVVPRRRVDTRRRPVLVKAYFAVSGRLPAFTDGLFGRGMITVSEEGRCRFTAFPDLVADDLFLDSLFSPEEKAEAPDVEVVVAAPYRTRDLLRRLVRVRRGNAQLRALAAANVLNVEVRPSDRWAWLREVVREPHLVFVAPPYVAITLLAGFLARRPQEQGWGRDESTRVLQGHSRGLT